MGQWYGGGTGLPISKSHLTLDPSPPAERASKQRAGFCLPHCVSERIGAGRSGPATAIFADVGTEQVRTVLCSQAGALAFCAVAIGYADERDRAFKGHGVV